MEAKAHDWALTVRVLRESAQYLNRNRRKKMVLSLPTALLADENKLDSLLYDVKILNKFIRIKFVLVCEISQGREQETRAKRIAERIDEVLARFGKGIGPLTKMARADAHLDAKGRLGASLLRRLAKSLSDCEMLLVSAYAKEAKTPTPDIASQLAVKLKADKLVYFLDHVTFRQLGFKVIAAPKIARRLETPGTIKAEVQPALASGSHALEHGTHRIHFIDSSTDGGIMLELMLPDNESSAMMYNDDYEDVRKATAADVTEIHQLIESNVGDGYLLKRNKRYLRRHIDSFAVVTHDATIIACASLINEDYATGTAEFCSFAVRSEYSRNAFGKLLLKFFEDRARRDGIGRLILVTARNDWFRKRGFVYDDPSILSPKRISEYKKKRSLPKVVMRKDLA